MSFLQKIEKMHIAAVRLLNVVMTLAVLVLGVVLVVYWVQAMQVMTQKKRWEVTPESSIKIDPGSVMGDVLAKSKGSTILPSDPNAGTHERIRNIVLAIEKSHRIPGDDPLDYSTFGPELASHLQYDPSDSKDLAAYWVGFANVLEAAAKNEELLKQIHAAREPQGEGEGVSAGSEYYSAAMLITALADDYESKFTAAKQKLYSPSFSPGENEAQKAKAFSMLSIYGLPFALLILILQTFIFARIAQNIRPADEKNGDSRKARKVLDNEQSIPTLNESDPSA